MTRQGYVTHSLGYYPQTGAVGQVVPGSTGKIDNRCDVIKVFQHEGCLPRALCNLIACVKDYDGGMQGFHCHTEEPVSKVPNQQPVLYGETVPLGINENCGGSRSDESYWTNKGVTGASDPQSGK